MGCEVIKLVLGINLCYADRYHTVYIKFKKNMDLPTWLLGSLSNPQVK